MFDKGGKEKNEKTKKDRTKLGDVISCRAVANRCLWWEKWIPIRFGLFLCFCIRFIFVGKVLVDTHFRAHLPFHLYTLYRSKKKRQNKTKQICFFFSTSFFFFLVLSPLPRTQAVCLFFYYYFSVSTRKKSTWRRMRDGFSHVERWNARKVGRDGCKAPHDCLLYFLLWIFVSNRSPYLLLLDGLLFSFYVFRSLVFIWYNHLVCFFSSPPIGHIFSFIYITWVLLIRFADSRAKLIRFFPVSFVVFFVFFLFWLFSCTSWYSSFPSYCVIFIDRVDARSRQDET